jgi:ATP-dependent DNA helicase RecG
VSARPDILFPLFAPVTALPGIGKHTARLIEKLCGASVVDLLWHLPTGIIDRKLIGSIAEAPIGETVTLSIEIDDHLPGATPRRPYRIRCRDHTGFLHLIYFSARPDYLRKLLPIGERRVISGKLDDFNGERQMTHPDHVVPEIEIARVSGVEPVHALTAGLGEKLLSKAIAAALERVPATPEWIDLPLAKSRFWPDWQSALATAHAPKSEDDILPTSPPRQRLAYDELLANQLALGLVRQQHRKLLGRQLVGTGQLTDKLAAALPFALTASQQSALADIRHDLAAPHRMLRLLQGDVGSGKTIVALMAMAIAVETGAQAALLAPTELLARQHYATITKLADKAGVRTLLLTGRDKGKGREAALKLISEGAADIVIGTHALFQDDVAFHDLAIAVVDEQHRFGVHQRLSLASKGSGVDVLVMTATPIPRTLMMTAYGDLEVSRLTEKPAGRQPIDTRAVPLDRADEVVGAIGRAISGGARVYWVCPLVEESETGDMAAAVARHRELQSVFGPRVGLLHGKMKPADKDLTMAAFAAGELDILVATTVIEVGVDVPEATVMVIEHAERFGLAQLHQLRGRIGRGSLSSTCLLLYQTPLGETAKARLKIIRETEDGFRIAEEDLRLRGSGELLGTRQAGMPEFRLADPIAHADLLEVARDDVRVLLDRDPTLESARGQALRVLLYLFEREAAVRYLRSG